MEQNKEKISSKIKGIKFVMDNGRGKISERIVCIWMCNQY